MQIEYNILYHLEYSDVLGIIPSSGFSYLKLFRLETVVDLSEWTLLFGAHNLASLVNWFRKSINILLTRCICVLCVLLRANSYYFFIYI
jgi:hypothetical protein